MAAPKMVQLQAAGLHLCKSALRCLGNQSCSSRATFSQLTCLRRAAALSATEAGATPNIESFLSSNVIDTARIAFRNLGRYHGQESSWKRVTEHLLGSDCERQLKTLNIEDIKSLVKLLAEDAMVMQASFWERMTALVAPVLEKSSLEDLMTLGTSYSKVQYWSQDVFGNLSSKVRKESAVHVMEPDELVKLLELFSVVGRSADSPELRTFSTQLFNEMPDRMLIDEAEIHQFSVESCITLVESMGRFRAVKAPVLQEVGRHRIHPTLMSLPATQISRLCRAYGNLGWRHDTIFRNVLQEILELNAQLQQARASGLEVEELPKQKYSASDLADVAAALVDLKMYRGNTTWFKWETNYQALLDVLTSRLDAELPTMRAAPLANASYVLGGARRGSEVLYKALYNRMMEILEAGIDEGEPPQHKLAQFLWGIAMMGPTKKKQLDTQWLMQWVCQNFNTLYLSDLILVNRHLVAMWCCDQEYLKVFIPLFCNNLDALTKTDIMELTNTYNLVRIPDAELGWEDEDTGKQYSGRHFYWSLGRRFQQIRIDAQAGRQVDLRRIG